MNLLLWRAVSWTGLPRVIVVTTVGLTFLLATATQAQTTQPAPRSLDPLPIPPLARTEANMVLSRLDGKPVDPIFRILGEPPEEPAGEFVKQTTPPSEIAVVQVLKNGDVLFGENVGLRRQSADHPDFPLRSDPGSSSPIDFWYDAQNRKLHVRSLLMTENGDAADLGLRRSGDGTYPNGPPLPIRKGQNLGLIHWMGWSDPGGFDDRSAQIYARAAEDITPATSGGSLHFATTPLGTAGAPVDRLVIGPTGLIGFGTEHPDAALHLVRADTSATAEDYPSSELLQPGDVVIIDPNAGHLMITRTSKPYDQRLVGVVCSNPALRISDDPQSTLSRKLSAGAQMFPVAASGRVTVKVSTENGPITPGDYLTSSSRAGVAMKASGNGAVIGKALENFSGKNVGNIKMLTDVTWFHP